jgi:hypothetical protein
VNRGHPDNPLPAEAVRDKFRDNARRVLNAARVEEIIAAVAHLEELPRVSELTRLCVAA